MNIVARLICEILRSAPITINELCERLLIAPSRVREIIVDLIEMKLLTLRVENDKLLIEPVDRLKLALYAVQQGASLKSVSLCLDWREFEEVCAYAFNVYGYDVHRNFRFKCRGRRFEIDVIGVKKPLVLCVDCKRWSAGRFSILHRDAIDHLRKVELLSTCPRALGRLKVLGWNEILLLPVMLTVHEDRVKIYDGIPIVPVFKFNSFLSEFEAFIYDLRVVRVKKN